ncbi:MAG: response regulator [Deltaproteobacteria bacterium]|nr:response regulator [Deltaproteobacteria bacterium]MBW2176192.1 response regulator [Deltaproteobacteria bacterium]MBW2611579.1 response regulator [Deltaproteobacteria bacterium]MBW2634937.1 response regulator [Deltaproteobacteria bacterium]
MLRPKTILLVEDDQVDCLTVKRALKEIRATNPMDIVNNGEEALKYLVSPDNDRPGIILLDLNMPRMNGIEFLKAIKKHPELKMIPVVILTTSRAKQDIRDSFSFGAAGYMVKPLDYREFVDAVVTIARYWRLSELPE